MSRNIPPAFFVQPSACFRQAHPAAVPIEEPATEFCLKRRDRPADRRRGDAEMGRGTGNAADIRHQGEISELFQVHDRI